MMNHALGKFRGRIEVSRKPFLRHSSQVRVHGGAF
jgi:hypothetical protein